MRRSEICALTVEDITKTTKTTSSTREIIIPIKLAGKIRQQGYLYKGHPNSITQFLERTERRLGIPEADIMRMGGWETYYVMKSVYRHSMMDKEEQTKRDVAEKLRNAFFLREFQDKFQDKFIYKSC